MGIHICIFDNNGDELPQSKWEYLREIHDRYFPSLIDWGCIEKGVDECEEYFKPLDIDRIRKDLKKLNWNNQDRYMKLLNFVEKENCWLWFCY